MHVKLQILREFKNLIKLHFLFPLRFCHPSEKQKSISLNSKVWVIIQRSNCSGTEFHWINGDLWTKTTSKKDCRQLCFITDDALRQFNRILQVLQIRLHIRLFIRFVVLLIDPMHLFSIPSFAEFEHE